MKKIYDLRKETMERLFANAKENYGLRYTNYNGKHLMEIKVEPTLVYHNLKKLVNKKKKYGLLKPIYSHFWSFIFNIKHYFVINLKGHLEFAF
ncbi:transposase [Sedimentibacter sp. LTW-03]|uniref:transposase n=1 Tax=Sedimentibacter sp. LTW-03 TaxID=3453406 RepID=UPI003F865A44